MKIEKVNLHDKTEYLIHIRNLKQTLNQIRWVFFICDISFLEKHKNTISNEIKKKNFNETIKL